IVKSMETRRESLLKAAHAPKGKEVAWGRAAEAFVCAEYAHNIRMPLARVESLLEGAFADDAKLGPAYWFRGLLELEKGRLTKAAADAEQAVALSPEDAHGYYIRGRVRLERGADKAVADLEQAAKISERKDADMLHWLAAALAQAGRIEDALQAQ